MRSIIYAGHDFSELCSAEVVSKSANPIIAEALQVPGRAGAMLVTGYLPPVDVTVKLFLDAGFSADVVRLAELRHTLSFWLCAPGGGELVLPDEPEHTYHDALLVSAGAWSKLFSGGQCEITFTLFDPMAYGRERIERLSRFDVGGTWPVLPEFRLVAAAGSCLRVGHAAYRAVRLDAQRGSWRGLRFTYGKNMAGCVRTVLEQDVYTALYGFGAGLPYTDDEGNCVPGYRRKLTFGDINGGLNYVADEDAKMRWGRWNEERTERVHAFGQVTFSDVTESERLLALTRLALAEAVKLKVSYEVDVAALDGGDADLGDTVAVIDTSREPEWRLTARVVRRVRTFGDAVLARVTIGTVQPVDYASVSTLAADVAALQDDVTGIDGNLTTAASVQVVESTVTEAIDDLDELGELDF